MDDELNAKNYYRYIFRIVPDDLKQAWNREEGQNKRPLMKTSDKGLLVFI